MGGDRTSECLLLAFHNLSRHPLHHANEQQLLVGEVVVDQRLANPRSDRDIMETQLCGADLDEAARRAVEDSL
jgi:hypothetical protein